MRLRSGRGYAEKAKTHSIEGDTRVVGVRYRHPRVWYSIRIPAYVPPGEKLLWNIRDFERDDGMLLVSLWYDHANIVRYNVRRLGPIPGDDDSDVATDQWTVADTSAHNSSGATPSSGAVHSDMDVYTVAGWE